MNAARQGPGEPISEPTCPIRTIATPYNQQVLLTQETLAADAADATVLTVHKYQGREKR